jgi:hypothetical protein
MIFQSSRGKDLTALSSVGRVSRRRAHAGHFRPATPPTQNPLHFIRSARVADISFLCGLICRRACPRADSHAPAHNDAEAASVGWIDRGIRHRSTDYRSDKCHRSVAGHAEAVAERGYCEEHVVRAIADTRERRGPRGSRRRLRKARINRPTEINTRHGTTAATAPAAGSAQIPTRSH